MAKIEQKVKANPLALTLEINLEIKNIPKISWMN